MGRSNGTKLLRTVFALLGAGGLVLKSHAAGPGAGLVHSYGGNLSASFAGYFVVALGLAGFRLPFHKLHAAGMALFLTGAFELTDGFGVMRNTVDAWDLAANALGVVLALALDLAVVWLRLRRRERERMDRLPVGSD